MLISYNYIASDFIVDHELPALLDSQKRAGTLILPVMIYPVDLAGTGLEQFQTVNSASRPLSTMTPSEQELVFLEIARAIHRCRLRKLAAPEPLNAADQLTRLADEIATRAAQRLASGQTVGRRAQADEAAAKSALESKLVFVIMPFADDLEPIYKGIYAAAKSVGLEAKRVKDIRGDYSIKDKTLEMILLSRLVVADLTGERPNVYYELGYARGIGKTVITLARKGTVIHFDAQDWPYIDSRTLESDLRDRLRNELQR